MRTKLMNRSLCGTEVHRWTRTGPIVKRARTRTRSLFFLFFFSATSSSPFCLFLGSFSVTLPMTKIRLLPSRLVSLSLFLSLSRLLFHAAVVKVQPLLARSGQSAVCTCPVRNAVILFFFFLSFIFDGVGGEKWVSSSSTLSSFLLTGNQCKYTIAPDAAYWPVQ